MSAKPVLALSAHETVAIDLMRSILDETERGREGVLLADADALDTALAARAAMLEALEQCVRTMAAASEGSRRATASSTHAAMIGLAGELEQANTTLLDRVRAERDLIAATIAATDRPDALATRYGTSGPTETHRLNLIR